MSTNYFSVNEAIAETYRKFAENLRILATDDLIWYMDRLLSAGSFDEIAQIMSKLDPSRVHVSILVAITVLVSHAKNKGELIPEWNKFFEKTCTTMDHVDPSGTRTKKLRARPWNI